MTILKVSLAVLVAFALGVVLSRSTEVKAQEPGKLVVVFIHPVLVLDKKMPVNQPFRDREPMEFPVFQHRQSVYRMPPCVMWQQPTEGIRGWD